mgnify:CR=1 FL=1
MFFKLETKPSELEIRSNTLNNRNSALIRKFGEIGINDSFRQEELTNPRPSRQMTAQERANRKELFGKFHSEDESEEFSEDEAQHMQRVLCEEAVYLAEEYFQLQQENDELTRNERLFSLLIESTRLVIGAIVAFVGTEKT